MAVAFHTRARIGRTAWFALAWAAGAVLAHIVPWLPDSVRKPGPLEVLRNGFVGAWEDLLYALVAFGVASAAIVAVRSPRLQRAIASAFALVAWAALLVLTLNAISVVKIGFPFSVQWLNYIHPSDLVTFRASLLGMASKAVYFFAAVMLAGLPLGAVLGRRFAPRLFTGHRLATVVALWLVYLAAAWQPHRALLERDEARTASALRLMAWEALISGSDLLDRPTRTAYDDWRLAPAADGLQLAAGVHRPNILLVVMDSVAARYLEEGAHPGLAPNMAALRRRSIYFDRFYTPAPTSTKSLVSLVTGLYPSLEFTLDTYSLRGVETPTIASELAKAGYRTSFIMSGDLALHGVRPFIEGRGFATLVDARDMACPGVPAETFVRYGHKGDACAVDVAARWMARSSEPFFQLLWLTGPHHPYHSERSRGFAGVNGEQTKYLEALHQTDLALGELLRFLDASGLADDTVLILASDHGEAFGEHGAFAHGSSVYQEQIHVPLMIALPGMSEPRLDPTVGGIVDIAPTLMDIAGAETGARWQGRSLFAPHRPQRTYFFSTMGDLQVGYVEGDAKKVVHLRTGEATRFDLARDPLERDGRALTGREEEEVLDRMAAWAQYRRALVGRSSR